MTDSELICIGVIISAHGLLGEVKIKTFTQMPQNFLKYKPLYSDINQTITLTKGRPFKDDIIIVKFDHLSNRNQSELAKGQKIFIHKSQLFDQSLKEGEVLYQDLIDLKVIDETQNHIGIVIGVHNYGAGDLLEIKLFDKGEEIFVPFGHDDVREINQTDQTIIIDSRLIDSFKVSPQPSHD